MLKLCKQNMDQNIDHQLLLYTSLDSPVDLFFSGIAISVNVTKGYVLFSKKSQHFFSYSKDIITLVHFTKIKLAIKSLCL